MHKRSGSAMILLGLVLIMASLCLTGYNIWENHRANQSTVNTVDFLHTEIKAVADDPVSSIPETVIPDYILNPDMEMPVLEYEGEAYIGTLEIPALDLCFSTISEWSDAALKKSPCRYSGSAYKGNFVIAAHNYWAHFGKLENLVIGDTVIFTDVDGNVFTYEVAAKEILIPTAVEEMKRDEWDLTLFTCTLGGANRVTIRCDRIQ
jgi:sortase A